MFALHVWVLLSGDCIIFSEAGGMAYLRKIRPSLFRTQSKPLFYMLKKFLVKKIVKSEIVISGHKQKQTLSYFTSFLIRVKFGIEIHTKLNIPTDHACLSPE